MVNEIGKQTERDDAPASASAASAEADAGSDAIMVDPRLDRLIGRSLQAHYADIVATPLPDQILVLLAQLEAKEKNA